MHSALNEANFEIQLVSATNVVSGYMEECVGACRGLSFLSFFSCCERSLLAGINITTAMSLIIVIIYDSLVFVVFTARSPKK